jgi:hypothetical protein
MMTRRTVLCSLGALAITTLPLPAAEFSGKWSGTAATPDQTERVLLILKVDGTSVQGSLGGDNDHRFPIENGRVDGDKVTFQLTGPNGALFRFDLTIDRDTLKGPCTRTVNGATEHGTIDLKRIA